MQGKKIEIILSVKRENILIYFKCQGFIYFNNLKIS